MKRFILAAMALCFSAMLKAQVATWLIPPAYDDIYKVIGADLIVTDSLDEKILWNFEGKRLFRTANAIFPYNDGMAVVTKGSTTLVDGVLSATGRFIKLDNCYVPHAFPYYSGDLFLVRKNDYYHFVDKNGLFRVSNCSMAYPLLNGYASCQAYKDSQKRQVKRMLMAKNGRNVKFYLDGKRVDDDELQFISSVNDEHLAVVVAAGKLYLFDAEAQNLKPVYAGDDSASGPQATIDGNPTEWLEEIADTLCAITAHSGSAPVVFQFDNRLMPVAKISNGTTRQYKRTKRDMWHTQSPLATIADNGRYGLAYDGKVVLPPQFEKVTTRFDDKAFVSQGGKMGMLRVLTDQQFQLSLNRGNEIAFRHQRVESTLRLELPPAVAAQTATVEMAPQWGCDIDVASRRVTAGTFGGSVDYDCVLSIPPSLADEVTDVSYQAQVRYGTFLSPPISFTAKAWHYKYFTIDVVDAETTVSQGVLDFTFTIKADRSDDDDADYPSTVNIKTQKLKVDLDKISETRYKCRVTGLRPGMNTIIIQIQEPGTPPTEYPLEVTYAKPAPKTSGKPAVRENVVIKNKTKRPATPTTTNKPKTPHLEI